MFAHVKTHDEALILIRTPLQVRLHSYLNIVAQQTHVYGIRRNKCYLYRRTIQHNNGLIQKSEKKTTVDFEEL